MSSLRNLHTLNSNVSLTDEWDLDLTTDQPQRFFIGGKAAFGAAAPPHVPILSEGSRTQTVVLPV